MLNLIFFYKSVSRYVTALPSPTSRVEFLDKTTYLKPVWPNIGIKMSNLFPNFAQNVARAVLAKNYIC